MKVRAGIAGVIGVFFVSLIVVAIIVGGCAVSGYNRAVSLDEQVRNSWAQVENQLQRRYELIPNLVETVKGFATHERELFENIAQARTQYFQPGSASEKVERAGQLEGLLSRLLVLQERYPDLKANENFLQLQAQLEGTENRIAVERKRYNDAVTALNIYRRGFPGGIFAGWAGVREAKPFEAAKEAQTAPKVDFSGGK